MKLIPFYSISHHKRGSINTLFGVYEKKPMAMAKWKESTWFVFQTEDGSPIGKDKNLVKIASCSKLEEVLEFLRSRQMLAFCQKESSGDSSVSTESADTDQRAEIKKKRNRYRKEVYLSGEYKNTRTGSQGKMIVKDLSFYGVGFTTIRNHDLRPEDIVHINFELDTVKRPVIRRAIKIIHVNGNRVGAEIVNSPEEDFDLGAYLLP